MSRKLAMRRWFAQRARPRTAGPPPSANGASSLHLRWDARGAWSSVSVDLTVEIPPTVPRLYFWALQADFTDPRGRAVAGAHLGLQWHPAHPHGRAVNWGGYRTGGGELDGSVSPLASATVNPNTRDHRWEPGRPYRLTIARADDTPAPAGTIAWRASVTDSDRGATTVVRDLFVPAERICSVVMWSEVFARCDDPATQVLWSHPELVDTGGTTTSPQRAAVNYQSHADGGCANTCSWSTDDGLRQRTNTARTVPQGAVLAWTR